ncbi:chaperonin 10-like protein [Aspergillus undulatus]|uniref:chaperonin 10-like protein n=1 Tax=Aspergillus undulatus TaxID=1810928 RepID=UPI003CCD8C4B
MTRTNRAVVWVSSRTLEIQNRPITPPGRNEVVVQIFARGICGSDAHNWSSSSVSKQLILGHESAGVIVEVGQDPGFACLKCEFCLRGNQNTCVNLRYSGLDPTDGTLQQYFTCGAHMPVPLPEGTTWEEAGAIQPLAIAVQLARRAGLSASKTVAIFGCGPLGLLVIATAKAYGVRKILVFDIEQSRIDFALEYGADIGVLSPSNPSSETTDPLTHVTTFTDSIIKEHNLGHGQGVDISIKASGAESCAQMALTILKPGGTCIQAGLGKQLTNIPLFLLTAKELNIKGTVRFTPACYEEAIDLVRRGKVDLEPLITAKYPLTRAGEAFEAQSKRKDVKFVILNQE